MLTFVLIPDCNNPVLTQRLHWHMRALNEHGVSYEIVDCPDAHTIAEADLILCTNISYGHTVPTRSRKKLVYIDPLMSPDIAGAINRAILELLPKQKMADAYESTFTNWRNKNNKTELVQVFAPGPSGKIEQKNSDKLSFVTGLSKIEEALAKDIKIDGIIISDSLALANPSPHALRLRNSVQAMQARHGAMFITTLANAAILSPYWPKDLAHLLIGVPENFRDKSVDTLANHFYCFPAGNVLTALILPTVLAFNKPVELFGFDGLLGGNVDTADLAHNDTRAQNKAKLDIFRYSYGSGLIFPQEYQKTMQVDTASRLTKYIKSGHSITAQDQPISQTPANTKLQITLKGMLYASSAFADNNKLLTAGIATALTACVTCLGMKTLGSSNTLICAIAITGIFLILLGFLHLRTRAKRLADLAERRANEKASRAFEATNKRLDELEGRLGNK